MVLRDVTGYYTIISVEFLQFTFRGVLLPVELMPGQFIAGAVTVSGLSTLANAKSCGTVFTSYGGCYVAHMGLTHSEWMTAKQCFSPTSYNFCFFGKNFIG